MILRRALQDAHREGLVHRNVADLVAAPPRRRREMRVLDAEQVRLFLGEARRTSPHYLLYLAAVSTGMRQGELLGLRWRDLDLATGRAEIQQTFYRLGRRQLFKPPKTPKSRRSVPLSLELVAELLRERDEQERRRRPLGDRHRDLGLVFCQEDGKPLHAHNLVRRDFRKVLARAGLPRIRFHDLRHTAATLFLARNVHPKIVADLLGHASVQVTLDTYSHSIPALAEEAVRDLGATLVPRSVVIPADQLSWHKEKEV